MKYALIDRDQIEANPANPREDLADLEQLADSIREHGILQPLIVNEHSLGRYRILAGHRRFAAAVMANVERVPCLVRNATGQGLDVMLTENLQRQDLNPIEEAQAIQALANHLGIKPTDLYPYIHKPVDHIWRRLLLLELSPEEQADVVSGKLKLTKALTLAKQHRAERDDPSMRGRRSTEWSEEARRRVHTHHFGHDHRLAGQAEARCVAAHHSSATRLARTTTVRGTACGPCWEETIRADERVQIETEALAIDQTCRSGPHLESEAS